MIAGFGVLLSLGATITVLPALLVARAPERPERRAKRRLGRFLVALHGPWRYDVGGIALGRPLAWSLGAVAVMGTLAGGPGFDTDYLNLQPRDSETVRLEREMVRRSDYSPEFVVFTAESRAELKELTWRLADDETVGTVRSLRSFEGPFGSPELPDTLLAGLCNDVAEGRCSEQSRLAVYAYPSEDVWEPGRQDAFLSHMRAIDPEVTGLPVLGRFTVDRSRRALAITAVLGSGLLALGVLADFWRSRCGAIARAQAFLSVPRESPGRLPSTLASTSQAPITVSGL